MVQNAEYSRGMNNSSLILTAETDHASEKDCIEMFRYNEIPYFLDMKVQRKDFRLQFCYDITSKRSLEQILDHKTLDHPMLLQILDSFDQACIQAENYMLAEDDILLDPEWIFSDNQTEQMRYCYLPGNQEDICQQFQRFMEYLLQRLDHKDEKAVQLAYGVYQRVAEEQTALHAALAEIGKGKDILLGEYPPSPPQNLSPAYTQADSHDNDKRRLFDQQAAVQPLKSQQKNAQGTTAQPLLKPQQKNAQEKTAQPLLRPQQKNAQEKTAQLPLRPQQKSAQEKAVQTSSRPQQKEKQGKAEQTPRPQQKEAQKKQPTEKFKNLLRKKLYTDSYRNMEDELVFEADEDEPAISHPTVCLMPETEGIQNRFIYQGTDRTRDFQCTEGKMILGSDPQESDICIALPMISRVHARVEVAVQGTFLEDMNSTNGTQVNGELLQYREKRMLQKGDIISLAGENYSFH